MFLAADIADHAQAALLSTWVRRGGNLIAMRPDPRLAGLLGLGADTADLTDGYLGVATGSGPGAGITSERRCIPRAPTSGRRSAPAWWRRCTPTPTRRPPPAVTLRSVGKAQAAAFTYDLARSVIGTRQGNLAWAGQERDGQPQANRSDNLFFPSWDWA